MQQQQQQAQQQQQQQQLNQQQQQQAQQQQQQQQQQNIRQQSWDAMAAAAYARGNSLNSNNGLNAAVHFDATLQQAARNMSNASRAMNQSQGGPTLPPHPKQKQLPMPVLPGAVGAPPDRLNSLRGISMLSRGLSNVARGTSVGSNASAILMRNSWEDKFFSMLMMDENAQNAAAQNIADVVGPTPIGPGASHFAQQNNNNHALMMAAAAHAGRSYSGQSGPPAPGPATVSDRSIDIRGNAVPPANNNMAGGGEDFSSVSSSDMP
jgi:multidrug efflux pump subunit AcrA (membrane-fusion protein)